MTKLHNIAVYTAVISLFLPLRSQAEGASFFSRYNLGINYATTTSYASISYEAPSVASMPTDCSPSLAASSLMHCIAYLGPDTSNSSDFSIYLDQPFKRQGFFYFAAGLTFSTISYKGGLAGKPIGPIKSSSKTTTSASTNPPLNPETTAGNNGGTNTPTGGTPAPLTTLGPASPDQPLTSAYMEMYGINWQTYLRFGITPQYLPDLLVTLGLGIQTAAGRLKIFQTDRTHFVIQPEAFAEIEAVLLRVSTGSLSFYLGQDQTISGPIGSSLIADNPSGTNLTSFQLGLVAGTAGVRVLFPF